MRLSPHVNGCRGPYWAAVWFWSCCLRHAGEKKKLHCWPERMHISVPLLMPPGGKKHSGTEVRSHPRLHARRLGPATSSLWSPAVGCLVTCLRRPGSSPPYASQRNKYLWLGGSLHRRGGSEDLLGSSQQILCLFNVNGEAVRRALSDPCTQKSF